MSSLKDIKIKIESLPQVSTNVIPLLHEICHALGRLLESGQETMIDLHSLPLTPADETKLLETLGRGEVEAQLQALGKSLIQESHISGVWFVEHFDPDGQCAGKYIEITFIPSILKSQPEDVQQGLERLSEQLAISQ